MNIVVNKSDRNGQSLNIGDTVDLYDWGGGNNKLATVVLIFDDVEGRVPTEPCIVEDPYDFWTKALPRCEKINL